MCWQDNSCGSLFSHSSPKLSTSQFCDPDWKSDQHPQPAKTLCLKSFCCGGDPEIYIRTRAEVWVQAEPEKRLYLCSVTWHHLVSCHCPPPPSLATGWYCICIFYSFFHCQEWVQPTGTQWVSVSTVLSIIRSSLKAADMSSLTMTLSNRWLYWFSITSEVLTISWKSSSCNRWDKRGKRSNRQTNGKKLILPTNYTALNMWRYGWSESNRKAALR